MCENCLATYRLHAANHGGIMPKSESDEAPEETPHAAVTTRGKATPIYVYTPHPHIAKRKETRPVAKHAEEVAQVSAVFGEGEIRPNLVGGITQPHGVDVAGDDEGVRAASAIIRRMGDGGVEGVGEAIGEEPRELGIADLAAGVGDVAGLAALVGVVAGLGAIVFYMATRVAEHYALGVIAGYYPEPRPGGEATLSWLPVSVHPFFPWLLLLVPTIGGLISGVIVFTFAPEAEGHGTDAVIKAFHHRDGVIRPPDRPHNPRLQIDQPADRINHGEPQSLVCCD